MTREELYELVWSKPMTHLAKEYGISDVAIRKHCKKLDIATPYLGYWAKLEHGKRVIKPPLSTKKYSAETLVNLAQRINKEESAEASQAAEEQKKRFDFLQSQLAVPSRLSGHLDPLVRLTKERLKQAKTDNYRFLNVGNSYYPSIGVGPASIPRVLLILSTLRKVAGGEGHNVFEENGKYFWQVKDERFAMQIYETKGKSSHEPTPAELKEQAQLDKRRREHPDWYSKDRKAYRTWDYRPSGRLTLELSQSGRYGWEHELVQHRWRDQKSKALELSLAEVFLWLASAEVTVRERRLKYEEERRIQAAAEEQKRIAKGRRLKAEELERYILKLCEISKTWENISKLLKTLGDKQNRKGWATSRLIEELLSYQKHLQSRTDETAVAAYLDSIEVDVNTPTLIPFLSPDGVFDENT